MTETSPEKDGQSKALPKALAKDEEEGVASAAGKDEQPELRKYKWLAVFLVSASVGSCRLAGAVLSVLAGAALC